MKKFMTIFGAILFATIILTSCGGSDEKTSEDETGANEKTSEVETGANENASEVQPDVNVSYSDDVSNEEDNDDSSSESGDNSNANVESSSSNNCDQFIKDYEEFVNSYIAIAKKMKANPSDMSIMTEYTEMASNAATMQSDAADCTDAKYVTKLSQLAAKMAKAMY